LTASDERYPNTATGAFVYEDNRQGYFDFNYAQPLLKPSQSKFDLHNRRDDRELATMTKIEDEAALRKEVTEAYIGLLRARLALEVAESNARQAALQYDIDSSKFSDGIIAEEDFLESASGKLDAQLAQFEAETAVGEKQRELALLLDIKVTEPIETVEPEIMNHPDSVQRAEFESEWEESVAITKAKYQLAKSERAADYAAGSHGLTGDLALEYSFGRGKINRDIEDTSFKENINTNSWGISLNLTYPIWDGGASSASVKAARFEADQARLEYQKAKQTAQAEIANLVNKLDVSYRRLDIVKKQIELAQNRLRIADSRLKDGQISELTWIENKVFYLETRDKYLEELTNYLTSRIELDGWFIG
jgi:outer membrane protein